MMAPGATIYQLFRLCQDHELWSPCSIRQVEFFTGNWTRFCLGTFFTYHENPLMALLALPLAAVAALVYYYKRKRSCKVKKLLKDEAGRVKEEQKVIMVAYRYLGNLNASVIQDSDSEYSLHTCSQETDIM